MKQLEDMIGLRDGLISNDVFTAEMHQRELERIFGRCWLFVGHESMIPNPYDYFLSQMGADSIIVKRTGDGRVRAFLNKCRHRGNEVCLFEAGNARSFVCSYHGWAYGDGGELTAVPYEQEAYGAEFDRSKWGLVEIRVATLGGLIFANWNKDACSLDDYLGDAKWWLETFLLREDMGGLEVVPGAQKYMMPVNWKLLAENFAGDDYHFVSTHASVVQVLSRSPDSRVNHAPNPAQRRMSGTDFAVACNHGRGAPHGFLEIKVGADTYEHDLQAARSLGSEAVEWVTERQRLLEERLTQYRSKPYAFHVGNIFPNFALIGVSTALYGKGLILHHPTAHDETEVWMWCAVEKSAPPAVKERQKFVLMQRQSAAGMVAPDDHENFQRISRNLRTPLSRSVKFHYGMALGHERDDPRPPEWRNDPKWPGLLLPQFSETEQRDFYRYWAEQMGEA